jgi:hypothetical protein
MSDSTPKPDLQLDTNQKFVKRLMLSLMESYTLKDLTNMVNSRQVPKLEVLMPPQNIPGIYRGLIKLGYRTIKDRFTYAYAYGGVKKYRPDLLPALDLPYGKEWLTEMIKRIEKYFQSL